MPAQLLLDAFDEFPGDLEFRATIDGRTDNEGLMHWEWLDQGAQASSLWLHNRTRRSGIEAVYALRLSTMRGRETGQAVFPAHTCFELVGHVFLSHHHLSR